MQPNSSAPEDPSPERSEANRLSYWALAVFGAAILASAIPRIRLLDMPLERDEGEYAYVGRMILDGAPPYRSGYTMKWPGTHLVYAAFLALFGHGAPGLRLGFLAVNLSTCGLLFALGRRLASPIAGAGAAAAYALLSIQPAVLGPAAHATHFVVFFALAGIFVLTRGGRPTAGRLLGGGALLGAAALMKQPGIAFLLAGGYAVLRRTADRRRPAAETLHPRSALFALLAGAALPFAALFLWLLAADVFPEFWRWTAVYARSYATEVPLPAAWRQFADHLAPIAGSAPALFVLAGVGAAAPLFDPGTRRAAAFAAILLAAGVLALVPGFHFRHHYFVVLLPSAALFVGLALHALQSLISSMVSARKAEAAAALLFGAAGAVSAAGTLPPFLTLGPEAASRALYRLNGFPESRRIASLLAREAAPGDEVAVFGSEPQIPFYAGLRSATPYLYAYPFMENQPLARRMQEEYARAAMKARPRFVVEVKIPFSWGVRETSDRWIFDWFAHFTTGYDPIAVAEIFPEGPVLTTGEEARGFEPRTVRYLRAWKRRD